MELLYRGSVSYTHLDVYKRQTEGRAKQIIEYMKNVLQDTTSIELWHVWLMDYYEFEDRPVTVSYTHLDVYKRQDL